MEAHDAGSLVDTAALAAYLEPVLGAGEVSVEKHTAGFSNETFYVTSGSREFVLRRPPRGPLLPTAHDVGREYRFLHALHGTAARVPRPLVYCEDASVIGAPFYVMERTHGVVIRAELPGVFDDDEQRRRIGDEMIDALAELHSVDWAAAGLQGKTAGYIDRQLARWQSQADLTVGQVRELPGLVEVSQWLAANKPPSSDSTVVHGDYKLDNVMFGASAPARLVAIFDWEMATIGDPLADLGWLLHTWGAPEVEEPGTVLPVSAEPGFPSREQMAERYAEKTGRHMNNFSFYHAMALWKLAIILEGLYVHYKRGTASNPAATEFETRVPALIRRAAAVIERA